MFVFFVRFVVNFSSKFYGFKEILVLKKVNAGALSHIPQVLASRVPDDMME
jgi:hypothetical protein